VTNAGPVFFDYPLHPVYLSDRSPDLRLFLRDAPQKKRFMIVSQEGLKEPLAPLLQSLEKQLSGAPLFLVPRGESRKNRKEKAGLEDRLLAAGADRQTVLVAVGGGTVTDLVGFTAGTLQRGVAYLSLPTTLLGMVDASLGGKTGVNTPAGKNMVGMFHPPAAVFTVLSALRTLPPREWRNGLAECLKHGLLGNADYFQWVADTGLDEFRRDGDSLRRLVQQSVRLKMNVAAGDPREASGSRHLLNLGHTVAHALEQLSGYRFPHGSAVACGLLWEAAAARADGYLSAGSLEKVARAMKRFGVLPAWTERTPEDILHAARSDKKNRDGTVRYVPLGKIGAPALPAPHTAILTGKALEQGRRLLTEIL
jgi:3-dehydroquinate synthase